MAVTRAPGTHTTRSMAIRHNGFTFYRVGQELVKLVGEIATDKELE